MGSRKSNKEQRIDAVSTAESTREPPPELDQAMANPHQLAVDAAVATKRVKI